MTKRSRDVEWEPAPQPPGPALWPMTAPAPEACTGRARTGVRRRR